MKSSSGAPAAAAGWTRWAAAAAALIGLALSQPAAAEQAPMAEARERFGRGVELYETGDYSAALAEFMRTYELRPHWALLLNIAQCYGNLGRYGEALRYLERYLEEGGDEVPSQRRHEVEAEIERLRSFIAHVSVSVNVDGATISVDDREVGTAPLEEPILVRSGLHVIDARHPGYRSARQEVVVAGGTTPPPVELHLEPIGGAESASSETEAGAAGVSAETAEEGTTATQSEPVEEDEAGGVAPGWFWATLGLTLAAGAGAVVTGALALQREGELHQFLDEVEAGQVTGTLAELEAQRADAADEAGRLALITDVLLITAGAAAITTLVLGFFTRFSRPESTADVRITGAVGPGGSALLTATGRF